MAAKGTHGNGGDAHPAGLQVSELNQRSAPLGVWNVCSFHVREEEWTFKDKATMQYKKGASTMALSSRSESSTRNAKMAYASQRAAETPEESPKYRHQEAEYEGREAAAPAAGASPAPPPTTKAAPAAVKAAS